MVIKLETSKLFRVGAIKALKKVKIRTLPQLLSPSYQLRIFKEASTEIS